MRVANFLDILTSILTHGTFKVISNNCTIKPLFVCLRMLYKSGKDFLPSWPKCHGENGEKFWSNSLLKKKKMAQPLDSKPQFFYFFVNH